VLLGWVTLGTLTVIGLGSLYKISELSGGGEHVALMLGGRAVDPQTRDPAERRLLNVVEEMALASGIAVPPVFVLENESGINAFAAGHQPSDAVVAVSAGALRYLTRDELQGVMGHEFSHILNGDMRLNLRLIGIVYGILVLAVIGYYVMRFSGSFSSSDSKKSGGAAGVFLFGIVLMVLGYIGVFFGNLIKSAISRQREFLADASAVQFTRNPGGISGALKKIGGLSEGSRIRDAHAEEVSHMFFGNAFTGGFFNLFATHPPLEERIRALEPDFDGRFPDVEPVSNLAEAAPKRPRTVLPNILGMPGAMAAGAVVPAVAALDSGSTTQRIGRQGAAELNRAGQLIGDLPQPLLDAVREPFVAPAVIYALLLSREDETVRAKQLQLLQSRIERSLFDHIQEMVPLVDSLVAASRLPLVELAVPALKKASQPQYGQFREVVDALVNVDGTVDLYEYCLRTVLFSYLDVHFGLKRPMAIHYRTVKSVAQPLAVVLSTLAYVGHTRPEDAQRAYACGTENLPLPTAILPLSQCRLPAFDAALGELARSSPEVKRSILAAMAACVAADGKIMPAETEILRAVAAVLGCPMPPLA
jgi:Zn-dependent protease with chaperone function